MNLLSCFSQEGRKVMYDIFCKYKSTQMMNCLSETVFHKVSNDWSYTRAHKKLAFFEGTRGMFLE